MKNTATATIQKSSFIRENPNLQAHGITSDHLTSRSTWYDTWVAESGVLLKKDSDADSFHAAFSLKIDVDTGGAARWVQATVNTQLIDQAPVLLHRSEPFLVEADSIFDEYTFDFSLNANFAPAKYNLIVEIRDASSQQILDTVSSSEMSNLRELPLESLDYEGIFHHVNLNQTPAQPLPGPAPATTRENVLAVESGGGSTGIALVAALIISLALKYHSTQKSIKHLSH